MFNTLLKKASESSFAALASEALDSRPGSPAGGTRRQAPGSPLAGQQPAGASSPVRKPRNPNARAGLNPLSSNAQLASQLDEAQNDIETFQKLLQKAAQEKSEASVHDINVSKNADQLKEENDVLNEELQEARALIKAMRATLEDKAAVEFLSTKSASEKGGYSSQEELLSRATATLADPLGATSAAGNDTQDPLTEKADTTATSSTELLAVERPLGAETVSSGAAASDSGQYDKVRELTEQLEAKAEQCLKLESTLAQRTSEVGKQKSDHDEKMKKMKAIFAAANKNLNEYRQSIAAKDEEIADLKTRLEISPPAEEKSKEQNRNVSLLFLLSAATSVDKKAIQDLEAELKAQSEAAAMKVQHTETKYKQANVQLEKLKVEYQQYKQRASMLLQQQRDAVQTDDGSQLRELQNQLEALTKENKSVAADLQDSEFRRSALEGELQVAMDQIANLESTYEISRRQERQQSRQLKDLERSLKDAQREREAAESRIASLQELRAVEAQSLMQELGGNTKHTEERLAKKEEENAELQKILDRSSDELAAAKQEIQNLRDLISSSEASQEASSGSAGTMASSAAPNLDSENRGQLLITTALGPRPSFSTSPFDQESPISRASSSLSLPADKPSVYSTLSDLLATKPLVERSPFSESSVVSSAKEKEYQTKLQHLTELLNESEANHQRLLDQEKVLKEEIRNLDRAERRQNLSVDYLKNIVLKYLETSDREPLLPVLTTVLQLSPAEVAMLRKKTIQTSASSMVLGGFFGGGGGH
ncbi:hypothetical protein BGZ99_003370 [Dissophora globulifera]|uniref:GRIP domain-containing protein n=1 Tax=Dissophora globulifera TaxID=979702 RepID=A0A9P6UWG6_9FUNG|nr:hypothetical protein BGZ99_003370 [Dissophora globulifera]